MSVILTPAQVTVLKEASDEWTRSFANLHTIEALDRRGLIESECRRGRYGLDVYVRRTDAGRAILKGTGKGGS